MKRVAVLALILCQLWLASPFCCCSLKAALIGKRASSEGGCCCADSDEEQQGGGSPERDHDCRCAENKKELPAPQQTLLTQTNAERNPIEHLFSATLLAVSVPVVDPAENWITPLVPPPLAVTDRLHELHRLIL